jgi:regulator of protease activity HflC (stomatin/prohibitin superfamily)
MATINTEATEVVDDGIKQVVRSRMEKMLAAWRKDFPQIVIAFLVVLFLVVFMAPRIFITIRAGEAGVLWKRFAGGTVVTRVYGEGLVVIFPWDVMTRYNMRVQQVHQELDVLTKTGLRIKLKLSIRYHPQYDMLGVLHQRVGPDYVNSIVIPEVEASLRTAIGAFDTEEVYTTKRALLPQIVNDALEQVAQRYIKVDDVIIKEVVLPEMIQTAIEMKLEMEQRAKAMEYVLDKEMQEARRKEIEAAGFQKYNEIITRSLTPDLLKWRGIEATRDLAASTNAKIVVVGTGPQGLPIILGSDN